MKTAILAAAALALSAGTASATLYEDNQGNHFGFGDLHDFFDSQGFQHLDIDNVEITNDSTYVYVTIQTLADLDATNWGKYGLGIDTGAGGGDNSNGWGRNIDWGRNVTHWVSSWADDGGTGVGGEIWEYNAGWANIGASYSDGSVVGDDSGHAAGVQAFAFEFAKLGLSIGDTFEFDVVSTAGGGGDPGVDHLSRSGPGDFSTPEWGVQSVAGQFLSYTLVPTPGSLALLGLGGLATARRRR